ncbi:MAG: hypothetical protein ACXAC7_07565 [Candidatus Hodarchaeales archaeon]|jgi:hypothetical protein
MINSFKSIVVIGVIFTILSGIAFSDVILNPTIDNKDVLVIYSHQIIFNNESITLKCETSISTVAYLYLRDGEEIEPVINTTETRNRSETITLEPHTSKDIRFMVKTPQSEMYTGQWVIDNWTTITQPDPFIIQKIRIRSGITTLTAQVTTNQILTNYSSVNTSPLTLLSSEKENNSSYNLYRYEGSLINLNPNTEYEITIFLQDNYNRTYLTQKKGQTLTTEENYNNTNNTNNDTLKSLDINNFDLNLWENENKINGTVKFSNPAITNITLWFADNNTILKKLIKKENLTEYDFSFISIPLNHRYKLSVDAKSLDNFINQTSHLFWFNSTDNIIIINFLNQSSYFSLDIYVSYNQPVQIVSYLSEDKSIMLQTFEHQTFCKVHNLTFSGLQHNQNYYVKIYAIDIIGKTNETDWLAFKTVSLGKNSYLEVGFSNIIVERNSFITIYPRIFGMMGSLPYSNYSAGIDMGEITVEYTEFQATSPDYTWTYPYQKEIPLYIPSFFFEGTTHEVKISYSLIDLIPITQIITVIDVISGTSESQITVSGSVSSVRRNLQTQLTLKVDGYAYINPDMSGYTNPTYIEVINKNEVIYWTTVNPDNNKQFNLNDLSFWLPFNPDPDIIIRVCGNDFIQTAYGKYRVQVLNATEADNDPPQLLDGSNSIAIHETSDDLKVYLTIETTKASKLVFYYGLNFPLANYYSHDIFQSSFNISLPWITSPGNYRFMFEFTDAINNTYQDDNFGLYYYLLIKLQDFINPIFTTTPTVTNDTANFYITFDTNELTSIIIAWGYYLPENLDYTDFNYYIINETLSTSHTILLYDSSQPLSHPLVIGTVWWAIWIIDKSGNENYFVSPIPLNAHKTNYFTIFLAIFKEVKEFY